MGYPLFFYASSSIAIKKIILIYNVFVNATKELIVINKSAKWISFKDFSKWWKRKILKSIWQSL